MLKDLILLLLTFNNIRFYCSVEFLLHKFIITYFSSWYCAEWFHEDALGLTPENTDKLIGFRCHICCKRTPPVCPHVLEVKSDVSQLVEAQSNAVVECNDEVSNTVPPLSEVYLKQLGSNTCTKCSYIFCFSGGPAIGLLDFNFYGGSYIFSFWALYKLLPKNPKAATYPPDSQIPDCASLCMH